MDFYADNHDGSAGLSVHEAMKQVKSLYSEQPGLPTEEAQPEPEAEYEEYEAQPEETDEVEGSEEDTPQAKSATEGESDDSESLSDDEKHQGYLRQQDYTKKTMALAEERKAMEKRNQELDAKLEQAAQLLDFENSTTNWQELRELDPDEYLEKKEAFEAKVKKYNDLYQEKVQQSQQQYQNYIAEQAQKLPQIIPEWIDEKVAVKELGEVRQHLVKVGYSEQAANSMVDALAISEFRKAMLYDRLQSAKPEEKKAIKKPKSAKPGTPKTPEERRTEADRQMFAKLEKTGSRRDAQAIVKKMLKR